MDEQDGLPPGHGWKPSQAWFDAVAERINTRARWQGDCLVMRGFPNHNGHLRIKVLGKRFVASRAAWMLYHHEAAPAGLVVRHTCDNPPCVAPDHLLLGTQADNVQDRVDRDRTHRPTLDARMQEGAPPDHREHDHSWWQAGVQRLRSCQRQGTKQAVLREEEVGEVSAAEFEGYCTCYNGRPARDCGVSTHRRAAALMTRPCRSPRLCYRPSQGPSFRSGGTMTPPMYSRSMVNDGPATRTHGT